MSKQRRLGRGIDALLQGGDISQIDEETSRLVSVPLETLRANPDQPRKVFDEERLDELARSIAERGIIQPIIAELQSDGTYLIIAGERRYRAAQRAGLTVVPVLPGTFSEEEKLEIALIENVQRADLNAMEEARAYAELLERTGSSQDELAKRLGKSRPAIANAVRLLKLPAPIVAAVESGALSAGHARTLLALEDEAQQVSLAEFALTEGLSVRDVERAVASVRAGATVAAAVSERSGRPAEPDGSGPKTRDRHDTSGGSDGTAGSGLAKSVELRGIEERLIERLGTRVVVNGSDNRGRIEIAYLSMDDLDRIVSVIAGD